MLLQAFITKKTKGAEEGSILMEFGTTILDQLDIEYWSILIALSPVMSWKMRASGSILDQWIMGYEGISSIMLLRPEQSYLSLTHCSLNKMAAML